MLSLGAMTLQPLVLSLIPVLGANRLLGTYYGFYYLAQGIGVTVGNLVIGMAFDMSQAWGLTSIWLLLIGLGLTSALSIITLDGRLQIDKAPLLSVKQA
jgi:hypothetical protein